MTNFAACKPKRSSLIWRQNAILAGETLSNSSRATTRTGQSVLSNRCTRFPLHSNGNQTSEWNCDTSIYSGHSSTALSNRPFSKSSHQNPSCCCSVNGVTTSQTNIIKIKENQLDQTSVVSSTFTTKIRKCGLCKEQIKYFKEEYLCGHVYHGECIWRYEKLNPAYLSNQCPKNCLRRLMVKRTRSIESRSSNSSSSSSSNSSSE